MKEVGISQFRTKCLAIIRSVQRTKKPIRITRFGKAIAEVIPVAPKKSWIGSMEGEIKFLGDIVSPIIDLDDIEAMKD